MSFSFIMVLIAFFYYVHRRRQLVQRIKAKYTSDIIAYSKVKNQLKVLNEQNNEKEGKKKELEAELSYLKSRIEEVEKKLPHPESWNLENNIIETEVVKDAKRLAAKGKLLSLQGWNDLRQIMNIYMPDFMDSLSQHEYKPNLRETQVCVLLRLRFSLSEICNLIGMTHQSLGNCRKRLLKKMFGIEGTSKDFDERLLQQ